MGKQVRKQKTSSIVAGGFFRFVLYVCVAAAVVFIGKSAYDFGYAIFNQEPVSREENARDVTVVIKKEDSVYQIGKILKKKGLIEDAKVFVVQETLSNYKGKLQEGTYILNTGMTVDEMLEILAKENIKGQPNKSENDGKEGNSEIKDSSESSPKETEEEGGEEE